MDNNWQVKFDAWKIKVNHHLIGLCGMECEDIDDWCYADDFDNGLSPLQSAKHAFNNVKENCGL